MYYTFGYDFFRWTLSACVSAHRQRNNFDRRRRWRVFNYRNYYIFRFLLTFLSLPLNNMPPKQAIMFASGSNFNKWAVINFQLDSQIICVVLKRVAVAYPHLFCSLHLNHYSHSELSSQLTRISETWPINNRLSVFIRAMQETI